MIKLTIAALIIGVCLAGCATPQPVDIKVTHYEVIMPPSNLLACGSVKLPEKFKSNKDVAKSYVKLWKHNQYCHNHAVAVLKYLDNAQKETQ